jgi:hypothetical protein
MTVLCYVRQSPLILISLGVSSRSALEDSTMKVEVGIMYLTSI